MNNSSLTVLSGGGSPHHAKYKPVYDFIKDESFKRNINFTLLDYVGIGQYPEMGKGLSLPCAVEKICSELPSTTPSRLLCRSFGCWVVSYLLSENPDVLANYNPIIMWGPTPFHQVWEDFAKEEGSLEKFNAFSEQKGVKFNEDFWPSMVPIEVCAKKFKDKNIIIGYGTEDVYCNRQFANYLNEIILKNSNCQTKIIEISGARHEVKPTDSDEILNEYLSVIFDQ